MKSIAEIYHESNRLQIDFASTTVNNVKGLFMEKAKSDEKLRLLDIGCGDGKVLREVFVEKCGLNLSEVVGTDKSVDMVTFAREKYGDGKKFYFHVLDIESSNLSDKLDYFDVVTSYFVFHWIKNYKQAIKNAHSFLKPGGIFHLYFVIDHSLAKFFNELATKYKSMEVTINQNYPPVLNDANFQENFECTIREQGFLIEKEEVIVDFYDFVTLENFKSLLNLKRISLPVN